MNLRKSGFRRRRINRMKRDEGQIGTCVGLFFVVYLAILLTSQLQLEQIRSSSGYMEDALAAANLASAIADIKEYGATHRIVISEPEKAYELYCRSLYANLGLDENGECVNKKLIAGRVQIEKYVIYNVNGGRIDVVWLEDGQIKMSSGAVGSICAPNGLVVENTGVYSEISYPVEGLFGLRVHAQKGKLVDIVGTERGDGV